MKKENTEVFNVAVAPNTAYINYTLVLLQSLFETNPDRTFHFFFLNNELEEKAQSLTREVIEQNHSEVDFIKIDVELFKDFPVTERFSVETYFRLAVQEVLPETVERLLYLDCDMIVCRDISKLYQMDFEDKYIAACGYATKCECGDEFNAGMLLMNLKKMREDQISLEMYRALAKKLDPGFYQDQGLLNAQFAEHGTKYVYKQYYNFTCPFYRKFKEKIKQEMPEFSIEDVVVMHFAGPGIRPWQMRIDKEELKRLEQKNLLDIFAANDYILDELYVKYLEKWWDYASRTVCYPALLAEMYQKKSEILEQVLCSTINTKAYSVGYKIISTAKKLSLNKKK